MIYYDGHSDVDWFYDGPMTFEEMRNSTEYKEVTEVPVLLRDNGAGKVYGYIRADEYAKSWGLILDPRNPEKTINEIFAKQNGTWVDPMDIVGQLLMRSPSVFSDDDAKQMAEYYPEWQVGVNYKQDWIVKYGKSLYKIAQSHTSQSQWTPGSSGTESLYTNIMLDSEGHYVWKQPTGYHDAYDKGDIVEYKGLLYESLIDGNSWSPDTYPYGWKLVSSTTPDPEEPNPDVPSEDSYPDFVQPTGAHDSYKKGDIVKFNGKLYQSTMDGNAYSPEAYPQGWVEYTED